ncbi:MAG: cysteine hydrolase [Methanomassiliicoccales archaeon]|nr:cysteine hydrolase [Methanomassiliicoccales archaeon]
MKPALLVIDVQNAWLDSSRGLMASVEERAEEMNEAIDLFRSKGLPIIVVYHTDEEGPAPGSQAFAFHPSIKVREEDATVVKNYPNAFNRTRLEAMLRERDCDTVMLVGLSASGCVLATYLGALDRDLSPYLVKDAVAGPREDLVRFAEEICDTLSLRAIAQFLG